MRSKTVIPPRGSSPERRPSAIDPREVIPEFETSEAGFRSHAEASPDPLALLDREGNVRYANASAARLLGYRVQDLIGRGIFDGLHVEDKDRARAYWSDVLAHSGVSITEVFRFRDEAGDRRALEVLGMNRLDTGIGSVILRFQDVTDRKQSEETRARLAAIVESSDDAIIGETLEGIVTTWNRAAERLFGYTAEEAIGRSITMTVPPDRMTELRDYMARVRRGDRVDHMETVRVRKDGSRLDVSITVSPIRDDSGAIIGLSKSSRDITERRQFEAELWRKNLELELANRAKDTFLASMSHELRTPLNSIIGFTGTMLMKLPGELTDDQERQLQLIQFSARHLLSLINDLLNLAKVQSGRTELALEPVRAGEALEEVGATLRPGAEAKGLSFGVSIPTESIEVQTDRRTLIQILMNLTTNAIKFTSTGGIRLEIGCVTDPARARTEVAFRVTDTGLGIRPEDQKHLFEPFEQFHREHPQADGGSGLGLHLSQRMANLLGGRIEVSSRLGQGSTFTLFLPERSCPP